MLNYSAHESRNIVPLATLSASQIMTDAIKNIGGWRGIRIKVFVPTQTTSASNAVTVYDQDEDGNKFVLNAFAAITGQGSYIYTIYPGLPTAAITINNVLGRLFSVDVVSGNANPMKYSVQIDLIP